MRRRYHKDLTFTHPLESVVLGVFRDRETHDGTTLAVALAGCASFGGRGATAGCNAYRRIALDVLGCLEDQGKLRRDALGWWRLPDPPAYLDRRDLVPVTPSGQEHHDALFAHGFRETQHREKPGPGKPAAED